MVGGGGKEARHVARSALTPQPLPSLPPPPPPIFSIPNKPYGFYGHNALRKEKNEPTTMTKITSKDRANANEKDIRNDSVK